MTESLVEGDVSLSVCEYIAALQPQIYELHELPQWPVCVQTEHMTVQSMDDILFQIKPQHATGSVLFSLKTKKKDPRCDSLSEDTDCETGRCSTLGCIYMKSGGHESCLVLRKGSEKDCSLTEQQQVIHPSSLVLRYKKRNSCLTSYCSCHKAQSALHRGVFVCDGESASVLGLLSERRRRCQSERKKTHNEPSTRGIHKRTRQKGVRAREESGIDFTTRG